MRGARNAVFRLATITLAAAASTVWMVWCWRRLNDKRHSSGLALDQVLGHDSADLRHASSAAIADGSARRPLQNDARGVASGAASSATRESLSGEVSSDTNQGASDIAARIVESKVELRETDKEEEESSVDSKSAGGEAEEEDTVDEAAVAELVAAYKRQGEGCKGTGPRPKKKMVSCCDRSKGKGKDKKTGGWRSMDNCKKCTDKKSCKVEICKVKPCGVRLHFLFLALDRIYHAPVWRQWFLQAPAGSYDVWVHCAKGACNKTMFEQLPMVHEVPRVHTRWCMDLVTAHVKLLEAALDSFRKQRGSADVLEKFVLLSESTLPSKPFAVVYDSLAAHRESDFCFMGDPAEPPGWPKANLFKTQYYLPKHGQFVILNHEDAAKVVQRWKPPKPMIAKDGTKLHFNARWNVPFRANNRDMRVSIHAFLEKHVACTDEFGIYATAFGAVIPDSRSREARICPVNYSHGCWSLDSISEETRCPILSSSGNKVVLIDKIRNDPNSSVRMPGRSRAGHGFDIQTLSPAALRLVRDSDHMFVRKFFRKASLPRYAEIVFS